MEGYRSGHNGAVLKTVRAASSQGFESLTLRHRRRGLRIVRDGDYLSPSLTRSVAPPPKTGPAALGSGFD